MDGKTAFRNFIWRFMEKSGAQLVSVIVAIVLARLLDPSDYGTIALVTVFIAILDVFVNCGLGNALIQKKNADEIDFSTVFFTNTTFCLLLYGVLFFAAPLIAKFYGNNQLIALTRVSGLTLIISGIKNVQCAYVSKNMLFKRFFFATLGGTIGSAIVGISMAYMGFGVWALVAQNLFNNTVDTIILWVTVKWRPERCFSFQRLKGLFSFGWKLLASSLMDTGYNNLRNLIIGKVYSSADLAFYGKGGNWPNMIVGNLNGSISSILLPAMSSAQDDPQMVKAMTRRAIKISTYVIAPLLMGLAAVSTPLVRLLMTEKWLPCVPFMIIFCVTLMFWPIHTANLNAINALGRSDIFLKLEIIKKTAGIIAIVVTAPISVMAMGYSLLFTSVASQIINSWPNKKLLGYGYLEQLKDIAPGILMAIFMGCCVYPIQWIGLPDIVTLLLQVPLGAAIYVLGSVLFKIESFEYLWAMVKPVIGKVLKRG